MTATSATRRRLPFGPRVSTRTVWLVAASWAPLVGLVVAGLQGGPPTLVTLLAIRLVVSFGAAYKASASRTRWRAMLWMATGAAITVVLAPWQPYVYDAPPQYDQWAMTRTSVALAASWYSLLAVLLYRRATQRSHEQADVAVGLASLWLALPTLAMNFTLTDGMFGYLEHGAPATTTCLVFGHRGFFAVPILDYRGLGAWMQGCHIGCVLFGVHLALAGLLPIALALLILLRIMGRRRWVHLVEGGQVPGWLLMDATIPGPTGIPVLTGDGQGANKVLARVPDTVHPFRAGAESVALVAVSPDRGSRAAGDSGC
jgi:hypothetical protein